MFSARLKVPKETGVQKDNEIMKPSSPFVIFHELVQTGTIHACGNIAVVFVELGDDAIRILNGLISPLAQEWWDRMLY